MAKSIKKQSRAAMEKLAEIDPVYYHKKNFELINNEWSYVEKFGDESDFVSAIDILKTYQKRTNHD